MTVASAPQIREMLADALERAEPLIRAAVAAPDWSAEDFVGGDRAAIRKAFFAFDGEVSVGAYEGLTPGTPEWLRTLANEAAEMCLKAANGAEDKMWPAVQARVEAIVRIVGRAASS